MFQSKLFGKTLRKIPKGAKTPSHIFLIKGAFCDQLASGIYSFLPLGLKVLRKIENIIREEMNKIGGEELYLPVMQPKEIWEKSGRWETMEPPLFKLKDRHEKEFALGPTHEEVIAVLARKNINSYKDLPLVLYQIQDKFRNEARPSGGLLRVREFMMKDLYSFHKDKEDLNRYYNKVALAYKTIFKRFGLETIMVKASSGAIGGDKCDEFAVLSEYGEDNINFCEKCGFAENLELGGTKKCPKCGAPLKVKKAIEVGHIFALGALYSEKMGAFFNDEKGNKKPLEMGCYGIGLGRAMATIVEVYNDKNGIIWPEEVAPFKIHLLAFGKGEKLEKEASKIYNDLIARGVEVLFDERDESAGVKLIDSDLIGIPLRVVMSKKTFVKDSVELKKREEEKTKLVKIKNLFREIKE